MTEAHSRRRCLNLIPRGSRRLLVVEIGNLLGLLATVARICELRLLLRTRSLSLRLSLLLAVLLLRCRTLDLWLSLRILLAVLLLRYPTLNLLLELLLRILLLRSRTLDLEKVWRTQRHPLHAGNQAFGCSGRRTRARGSRSIGTSIELLVRLAELNIARLLGHITTTLSLQLERYRFH